MKNKARNGGKREWLMENWSKIGLTWFGFYIAYLLYTSSQDLISVLTALIFLIIYNVILWRNDYK